MSRRDPLLLQVRWCVLQDDRAGAHELLRAAIEGAELLPRDGIELILALRQASRPVLLAAIDRVLSAPPGTYRYVPPAENAFV